MIHPPADDADLVRRLHHGDAAAAQTLYQVHGSALLRFALALCGCRQTAEDVVHDTFIELLRYPMRFDPNRGSLSSYLYAIARHRVSRVARSARRHAMLSTDEPATDDGVLTNGELERAPAIYVRDLITEGDAERAQAIEQVRAAVLDLPLIYREVIALCDLDELPYSEVALVLNCPVGTVRSRLHRARAQLAQRLAMGFVDKGSSGSKQQDCGNDSEEAPPASTMLACRGTVP